MSDGGDSRQGAILVIGAGLIGSSIGMAATQCGRHVYLQDVQSANAFVAAGLGAGEIYARSTEDIPLVIVAVPPIAVADVVLEALERFPTATVADVASVKSPVAEIVGRHPEASRYIGSHPMAGSHRSGPLTARGDLFVDRTWVVTPHSSTSAAAVADITDLATSCGARVEVMSPSEHDVAVAEVSHVPQIMSSLMALNLLDASPQHLRLAGQGVRDVTRIAASDATMWTQIITANHEAIRQELERVADSLGKLLVSVDSPGAVESFLMRGSAGVKALPGKHGRAVSDYAYVTVEIPDSPGALARLFADVGEAGVNIEDLGIEHDEDREVGYMSMAVEPSRANGLAIIMADKGWVVKP